MGTKPQEKDKKLVNGYISKKLREDLEQIASDYEWSMTHAVSKAIEHGVKHMLDTYYT